MSYDDEGRNHISGNECRTCGRIGCEGGPSCEYAAERNSDRRLCQKYGHDWDADMDGFVYCQSCGEPHPGNINPAADSLFLQDSRPDLYNPNGSRRGDY